MKLKPARLEEVTWADVRTNVKTLDPELFAAIEEFNPSAKHTLFKVCYPYGAEILKNGILQLPTASGDLALITDAAIPDSIRKRLNYNYSSNPVTFVLKNSAELFAICNDITVPFYSKINPGRLFGTFLILNNSSPALHPTFFWSLTAGSRSLLMLPNISDNVSLARLSKEFKMNFTKPKDSVDHWFLFRDLANHEDFGEDWELEVLFFTDNWFDWSNKSLNPLRLLMFERAWDATDYWRNQFIWNLVYSIFIKEKIVKINPHIADLVKHLASIGISIQPGFAPALDNKIAPIARLQKIFVDVYRIHAAPIMMSPEYFQIGQPQEVYYSLDHPAAVEFSPNTRRISSRITDLLEIQQFLKKYLNFIKTSELNIQDSKFFELAQKVKFEFFHQRTSTSEGVHSIDNLFDTDPSFINSLGYGEHLPMPKNASFLKGCIRISNKE